MTEGRVWEPTEASWAPVKPSHLSGWILRNLDLSKFCIGQKEEQLPSYDLYAVISHYGGMIGGHYTACARLPNDRSSQRSDVGEGQGTRSTAG